MTSGSKPEPHLAPQFFGQVLHTAEHHFCKLITWDPIKDCCSDRITIWYIRNICSFRCSSISCSPIFGLIDICTVTVKNTQFSALLQSDSTNIDRTANWRIECDRASKTASFTYISCCDMIRTHVPIWSKISEIARMWDRPTNCGFSVVQFFDRVKPVATVPVQFPPRPGTDPWIGHHC